MPDKPPFDPIKACFYLIAGVIAVECLVVIIGITTCLVYVDTIMSNPKIECDPKGKLQDLLQAALTAALAFAAGFTRKHGPPNDPDPPSPKRPPD